MNHKTYSAAGEHRKYSFLFIVVLPIALILIMLGSYFVPLIIGANSSGSAFIPNLEVLSDTSSIEADRSLTLAYDETDGSVDVKDSWLLINSSSESVEIPIAYLTFYSDISFLIDGEYVDFVSIGLEAGYEYKKELAESKIRNDEYIDLAMTLDAEESKLAVSCHTTDVTIPAGSSIEIELAYSTKMRELKLIESSDDDLKCNSFTLTCDDPDIIISTNTGLADDCDTVQLDPDKRNYYIKCKSAKRLQKEAEKNPPMPPVIVTHSGRVLTVAE